MPQRLRCLLRKQLWHNDWDAEKAEVLWTCKRCGLVKAEFTDVSNIAGSGGSGGSGGAV